MCRLIKASVSIILQQWAMCHYPMAAQKKLYYINDSLVPFDSKNVVGRYFSGFGNSGYSVFTVYTLY